MKIGIIHFFSLYNNIKILIFRAKKGIFEKLKELASRRTLKDYTNVPVLSWNNDMIKDHINKILEIPESKIAFGGNELKNHKIPKCYGSYEPTAIYVPLKHFLSEKYRS